MPALVLSAALLGSVTAASTLALRRFRAKAGGADDKGEDLMPTAAETSGGEPERPSADELLTQLSAVSKATLYVVTNATNDKFSLPNLTKFLKMKGVDVYCEGGASAEEAIRENASRLLRHLAANRASAAGARDRLRHELVPGVLPRAQLELLLPSMKEAYVQQPLDYGRNSRYGDEWKISCYLVVMEKWKPNIMPHAPMVACMTPTMDACTAAYSRWYCGVHSLATVSVQVMNAFVTRYRPIHNEDQLKKHIDGANVDGSVILALPTDDPFQGGTLHVWDGKPQREYTYVMEPGDCIFLDNSVWHQAKPITSGTRWALVLFLRLTDRVSHSTS